eukprot:UN27609
MEKYIPVILWLSVLLPLTLFIIKKPNGDNHTLYVGSEKSKTHIIVLPNNGHRSYVESGSNNGEY